jgi:hypothetical protein
MCSAVVMPRAYDEDLLARQSALQDEAREVLADLDLAGLVADIGPLLITGRWPSRRAARTGAPAFIVAAMTRPGVPCLLLGKTAWR